MKIGLVGNQNSGKTTLFNLLTGMNAKIGNWPGVTIEKKTGTEKLIPKIIEGFTKTMQEKYGVDSVESDKLIVNFIKVIEDASSYLFSKNHADPYSWIGYICGYL